MKSTYLYRRKAQSGLELIVSVAMVLLVFSIVYIKIVNEGIKQNDEELRTSIKYLSNKVAYYLDIAYQEGDGFKINLSLPQNIKGRNYNISVNSNYVIISIGNLNYLTKTLPYNLTNQNLDKTRKNEIYNKGGKLYVTYY